MSLESSAEILLSAGRAGVLWLLYVGPRAWGGWFRRLSVVARLSRCTRAGRGTSIRSRCTRAGRGTSPRGSHSERYCSQEANSNESCLHLGR
uniref:Uncharacterized protein n=1 Tax=Ixodes ricinus TaxID=34613 RepID=A0A6B0U434_IXORI